MIKPLMASGVDAVAASAVRTSASFLAHLLLIWAGAQVAQVQKPLNAKTLFNTWASAAVAMALGMTLILQALKTGQANLVGIFSSLTPILLLPLLWPCTAAAPLEGLGAGRSWLCWAQP